MDASLYADVASIMRFWFILIILYILFRTVQNAVKEYRYSKHIRTELERRFFGYLDVVHSDVPGLEGKRFVIRRENLIGRSKRCDVTIESQLVDISQALVTVRDKKLYVSDVSAGTGVLLNGSKIHGDQQIDHGDVIGVGDTQLRVSLEG